MKTLRTNAVAILIYQLFKEAELLDSFGLQHDAGPPKIVGSRTGIELDLIL
jgi:hypothetical protein